MLESSPVLSANPVLSVSSLNRLVRDCLESSFPLTWVAGEISNLTYAASGHVYFSLKDASSQVRCVMWRNRAQLLGWRLENGQQIEARTLVSFYEPRGEFQLNVEAVRRAGKNADKAKLQAAMTSMSDFDVGGFRINLRAGVRDSVRAIDLVTIRPDGKVVR